jgi:hypothetical protein
MSVKVVKVNFSTVQPIYTKIYKLQQQITLITTARSVEVDKKEIDVPSKHKRL